MELWEGGGMCTPLVEAAEDPAVCWGGAWGAPADVELHLGLDFPACLRGCMLCFGVGTSLVVPF